MLTFEETGLPDKKVVRETYDLVCDFLREQKEKDLEEQLDLVRAFSGGAISHEDEKAVRNDVEEEFARMNQIYVSSAKLVDDSGAPYELIAASLAARIDVEKDGRAFLDRLDKSVIERAEAYIALEENMSQRIEGLSKQAPAGTDPDVTEVFSEAFALAAADGCVITEDINLLLRAINITATQYMEELVSQGKQHLVSVLYAFTALGRVVEQQTKDLPATPLDERFQKTLERAEKTLVEFEEPENDGPNGPQVW